MRRSISVVWSSVTGLSKATSRAANHICLWPPSSSKPDSSRAGASERPLPRRAMAGPGGVEPAVAADPAGDQRLGDLVRGEEFVESELGLRGRHTREFILIGIQMSIGSRQLMRREERVESILAAAGRAFARTGFKA